MDKTDGSKADAGTDTSDIYMEDPLSISASISTDIPLPSITSTASSLEVVAKKNNSKLSLLVQEGRRAILNKSSQKNLSDDSSSSTSSSVHVLPVLRRDATTSIDKMAIGYITSTASTMTEERFGLPTLKRDATTSVDKLASDYITSTVSTMTEGSFGYPVSGRDATTSIDKLASEYTMSTISAMTQESFLTTAGKDTEKQPVRVVRYSADVEVIPKESDIVKESKGAGVRFTRNDLGLLPSSKSEYVTYAGDGDLDSLDGTNLEVGHVFVYMVVPPDGGYGWVIAFISFLVQIVVDGIVFSIGIILPHIARDFDTSDSRAVLIASMQVGFYYLSGTFASAFINKFGFRPVAFTGSLLAITVLTISTFSVNLSMMIIFYSVLGGPSLSMIWVSSQLVIGYYFDRYRPIANGASCSGAGVGIMVFSYMNSMLLPLLSWRNLMRLHVGFLVAVLLMTLAYFEVAPTRIGRVAEALDNDLEDTDSDSLDILFRTTEYSRYSIKIGDQEYPLDDQFEKVLETDVIKIENPPPTGYLQYLQKYCPFFARCLERLYGDETTDEAAKRYVIKQDLIERHDLFYSGPKDRKAEQQRMEEVLQKRLTISPSRAYDGSKWQVISLDEIDNKYRRQRVLNTLSMVHVDRPVEEERKYRQTFRQLKLTEKFPLLAYLSPRNWMHPKILKALDLLFDLNLLDVKEFRVLLLSAFLFPMGFNIPFVYSTVRAQIDASFARLITPTIGFSNFAFRIASGFVAFKFREYTTYICGGGMFLGGFTVFISAFCGLDLVWFQFLYAFCYGIAPAFYSTLRAIIYVRVLGLDKLTNAFGLTAVAMGLGVFIGTTTGGMLNDLTDSYTASFIFAGLCICTAGSLKLLLPYFIKLSQDEGEK